VAWASSDRSINILEQLNPAVIVRTRIGGKCARAWGFLFSALRGGGTANPAYGFEFYGRASGRTRIPVVSYPNPGMVHHILEIYDSPIYQSSYLAFLVRKDIVLQVSDA